MDGYGGIRFPETVWTRIRQAGNDQQTAIDDFVRGYREPVRRFIIMQGIPAEHAEDLVQEVFIQFFDKELLSKADSNKGRFRSFLIGVTKNILGHWREKESALKRGGGKPVISLDDKVAGETKMTYEDVIAAPKEDESFDRVWMEYIFERAYERLKHECDEQRLPYYDALSSYIESESCAYSDVAKQMGVTEQQVKNYIHRAKKKLIDLARSEISRYCSSEDELRDEVRHLARYLPGSS